MPNKIIRKDFIIPSKNIEESCFPVPYNFITMKQNIIEAFLSLLSLISFKHLVLPFITKCGIFSNEGLLGIATRAQGRPQAQK